MIRSSKFNALLAGILPVNILLYGILGYLTPRNEFGLLMLLFCFLFLSYFLILRSIKTIADEKLAFLGAVLFRFVLLLALPKLSDDIFRFIWDGRLWSQGINPFSHPPDHFISGAGSEQQIPGINEELYSRLNSRHYHTIYPLLPQAVFRLATGIFPNSITGAVVVIRIVILAFEFGSITLLRILQKHFDLPLRSAMIYAINPLVIMEFAGNLHLEAIMIFFLLLAFYFLIHKRILSSAVAFSGAVIAKLIPLILLPALVKRLGWKRFLTFSLVTFFLTGLSFWTLLPPGTPENYLQSIMLYFQKFEFNAGIYYLFRKLGYLWKGYNLIAVTGKLTTLLSLLLILLYSWREKRAKPGNFPVALTWTLSIYLLFSTTVHPWYILPVVAFCIFTQYRFPVIWTFLITVSYHVYQTSQYSENLWWTGFEYAVLYLVIYLELYQPKSLQLIYRKTGLI